MIFGILVFVFFFMAIDLLGPLLIEGLGLLVVFSGRCLVIAGGAILFAHWKALTWAVKLLVWLAKLGISAAEFLYVLCDEIFRGLQGDEEDFEQGDIEHTASPYEDAWTVLNLSPGGFTRQEFKTAYRHAIGPAHPDKGGSEEEAQVVNLASDAIKARHGWR
jgi:hypothetical protein